MIQNTFMEQILRSLRKRQRLLNAVDWGIRGMFYATLAAMIAGLYCLLGSPGWAGDPPWLVLLLVPLGGLLGMLVGVICPLDPLRLARALDRAADSQDRFASALQLIGHHRKQRVEMIVSHALSTVENVEVSSALPLRYPVELKWWPLACIMLACLLWLGPGGQASANVADNAEISADQWKQLEDDLRDDLDRKFDKPQLPEEKNIAEQLKQLASSLARQPEKKNVLAQIASLRSQLNEQRKQLKTRDINMRKASGALRSSKLLKNLAELLKNGDYKLAAEELENLAQRLSSNQQNLTAEQMERISADFERLSRELDSLQELSQECKQCSWAANSLNQNQLAQSLQKLSECLSRNSDGLKKNDSLCKACSVLDNLERRLARTKSASQNNAQCSVCQGKNSAHCAACQGKNGANGKNGFQRFVKRNDKKGGLKAGWGTAANWQGGTLSEQAAARLPVLVPDQERDGQLTTVSKTISIDERAESALAYKQKLTELVRKAEADLALEEIPLSYREFLRRYFRAIKPQNDSAESESGERSKE